MSPESSPPVDGSPSLAVRFVRGLMERHGLPKYRQSAWLADATGLSYAQAHRRMSGAASWTLEELERVAVLFGETLEDVVALGQTHGSVSGVMKVGGAILPCELWLGDEVHNAKPDTVVAVKTSSGWAALCASDAVDQTTYAVERLQAKPCVAQRKTVAVLDDDEDLTNSICSHLQADGYEARAFYRTTDLEASVRTHRYDAFVVDWIVGEASTARVIAALRAQDPGCPIVVLTAQVLSGLVQESEIAEAVTHFNLVFSEKPVRMVILSASLARAFALR